MLEFSGQNGKCKGSHFYFCSSRKSVHEATVRHDKKLRTLSFSQGQPSESNKNSLILLDDINPPAFVREILSKGTKHPTPAKFNKFHFFAEINRLLEKLDERKIEPALLNHINAKAVLYPDKRKQYANKVVRKVVGYLQENDIVDVPFDKGLGFCLMKRSTYNEKMDDLCELPQFQRLGKERINAKQYVIREQERFNKVLLELKKKEEISEQQCQDNRSCGAQIAKLYGLAKVHKNGIPMRPIVSLPGTCYQHLAKKLSHIMILLLMLPDSLLWSQEMRLLSLALLKRMSLVYWQIA